MQVQMSFVETAPPVGLVPVWAALDEEQRAMVLTALARLIAKAATTQDEDVAADAEECNDE